MKKYLLFFLLYRLLLADRAYAEDSVETNGFMDAITIGQSLNSFEKKEVKPAQFEKIQNENGDKSENIQIGVKYEGFLCGKYSFDCGLDIENLTQIEFALSAERNKNDLKGSEEDKWSFGPHIGFTVVEGRFEGLHTLGIEYQDNDIKKSESISYQYSFVPTGYSRINAELFPNFIGGAIEFYLSVKYDYIDSFKTEDKLRKKGSASRLYLDSSFVYLFDRDCLEDDNSNKQACKWTLEYENKLGYDFSSSGIYEFSDDDWTSSEFSLNYSIAKSEGFEAFISYTHIYGDNRIKFIDTNTDSFALKFRYVHE